jgi:hypothetical protein
MGRMELSEEADGDSVQERGVDGTVWGCGSSEEEGLELLAEDDRRREDEVPLELLFWECTVPSSRIEVFDELVAFVLMAAAKVACHSGGKSTLPELVARSMKEVLLPRRMYRRRLSAD